MMPIIYHSTDHTITDNGLLLRKILYSFISKKTESPSQSGFTQEQHGNEI